MLKNENEKISLNEMQEICKVSKIQTHTQTTLEVVTQKIDELHLNDERAVYENNIIIPVY